MLRYTSFEGKQAYAGFSMLPSTYFFSLPPYHLFHWPSGFHFRQKSATFVILVRSCLGGTESSVTLLKCLFVIPNLPGELWWLKWFWAHMHVSDPRDIWECGTANTGGHFFFWQKGIFVANRSSAWGKTLTSLLSTRIRKCGNGTSIFLGVTHLMEVLMVWGLCTVLGEENGAYWRWLFNTRGFESLRKRDLYAL